MKFGFRELLFFLVIVGLLGASYFFIFKPADAKRAATRDHTKKMRKELTDLRQATAGIGDLGERVDKLQKAISFFESKLPQQKEMDKILDEVSRMAETNNLTTKTFKTLKMERGAAYSEQPIQMSMSGDFTGFYTFLLQLEKLPRITRITNMNLQKIHDQDGQMQAQITLVIYFEPDTGSDAMAGAN